MSNAHSTDIDLWRSLWLCVCVCERKEKGYSIIIRAAFLVSVLAASVCTVQLDAVGKYDKPNISNRREREKIFVEPAVAVAVKQRIHRNTSNKNWRSSASVRRHVVCGSLLLAYLPILNSMVKHRIDSYQQTAAHHELNSIASPGEVADHRQFLHET